MGIYAETALVFLIILGLALAVVGQIDTEKH